MRQSVRRRRTTATKDLLRLDTVTDACSFLNQIRHASCGLLPAMSRVMGFLIDLVPGLSSARSFPRRIHPHSPLRDEIERAVGDRSFRDAHAGCELTTSGQSLLLGPR